MKTSENSYWTCNKCFLMGRGNIDITYRTLRVDSINYKMLKKQDEYRNYSSSAA